MFSLFGLLEISVPHDFGHVEQSFSLGHLWFVITDVPPQPNSPSENVSLSQNEVIGQQISKRH